MNPCTTPCKECPFKRDSAKGYLGEASFKPNEFLWPIWMEEINQPCHMSGNSKQRYCAGVMRMMRNAGKLPRRRELAAMVQAQPADPDCFTFPHEFIKHHSKEKSQ